MKKKDDDHQVFAKMPQRHTVLANTPSQPTTTLRRSPRFLHPNNNTNTQQTPQPTAAAAATATTTLRKSQRLLRHREYTTASENPNTSKSKSRCVVRSLNPALSAKKSKSKSPNGSRESSTLNQSLRRSSRILNRQLVAVADEDKHDLRKKLSKFDNGSRKCRRKSMGFCNDKVKGAGKDGDFVDLQERVSKKSERVAKKSSVGVEMVNGGAGETKMQELDGGFRRKRKRDEKGFDRVYGPQGIGGVGQGGWTKEQEMALQRAYLLAKPTPHFWKKVSKLVPGKSAQECFDKVHSEQITPPQPRTRSRAHILTNSSPLGQFSLSASKLLKPTELKAKRPTCNKKRSHIAQKTVRKLLQKHYQVYQDCEVDLFSVFEPSVGPSAESQPSVILSTPNKLQERQGVLQKCITRSSSGHKKPLSRFSSSCGTPLVSPPVLKQVRNKVWHEKYIDQLHNREAKRKAASTCTKKSTFGIDNRRNSHVQKVDVIRTAKLALVSDARDAISKVQHLQANAMENLSDLDDDAIVSDDEENEDDT